MYNHLDLFHYQRIFKDAFTEDRFCDKLLYMKKYFFILSLVFGLVILNPKLPICLNVRSRVIGQIVLAPTPGPMGINTWGNGKMTYQMDRAPTPGPMGINTWGNLRMANEMDRALSPGPLEINTWGNLRMANEMDRAP